MLTNWMLLRCLFLADEVDPPPAKPPDMVFIVLSNWGGSVQFISVWAGG